MQGQVAADYDPIILHLLYAGLVIIGVGLILAILLWQHNRFREQQRFAKLSGKPTFVKSKTSRPKRKAKVKEEFLT